MPEPFLPPYVNIALGAVLIIFGVFRLLMARRPVDKASGGLKGLAPRTHILFGALYALAGLFLIAAQARTWF